jgi:hypothetical protein
MALRTHTSGYKEEREETSVQGPREVRSLQQQMEEEGNGIWLCEQTAQPSPAVQSRPHQKEEGDQPRFSCRLRLHVTTTGVGVEWPLGFEMHETKPQRTLLLAIATERGRPAGINLTLLAK